jgi:peptidoglycan/LPS O-acetylase OafA/YrhL
MAAPDVWSTPLSFLTGHAGGVLSAALSSTAPRLTQVSYGIYLYHLPIYSLLLNNAPGRPHYFYAGIVLAASLLAAACSWILLESPIVRGIALVSRIERASSVRMRRHRVAGADGKRTRIDSNDRDQPEGKQQSVM